MDLAPFAQGAAELLQSDWTLPGLRAFLAGSWPLIAAVLFLTALLISPFGRRVRTVVEEMFFTNWQLALLGTAALVLSLAGGWTTWDGMKNFTGEPVLSLMFTFGIHGVMLIVAWLIGESFATGMSTVSQSGLARVTAPLIVIVGLGAVLLLAALGVYQWRHGVAAEAWMQAFAIVGGALLCLALVLIFSKSDVVAPYTQALRIIAKNAMLWVMFLATMGTSVFFSFDSRFNVVFPEDERRRVADLRAQNQVTGILADIETTIAARRLEQARFLFESDGWRAYDEKHLARLAGAAQGAQGEIERYFVQQMEERRRAVAQQQERVTTAQSGQAGLAAKKITLTEELARLKGDRPGLAAEFAQHKSELDAKQKDIDAKRVEALAEDRGVEGTLKQGKGPMYRERMTELGRLQDEYKIKEERTKDAQKRLNAVDSRLAQVERELLGIDGEIAKLKGEAQTAEQRIKATQDAGTATATDGPKVDPARALLAFENARAEFRQEPAVEKLGHMQQLCAQLHGALSGTPATKDKVRSLDCDPKQASEAAAPLFALNAGIKAFETGCSGGDKLAQHTNADALFGFARKCLADSGLPSKDTDALRTKISFTELTRDDRAHRFVVSWNAFSDGNRLAYLALAIAIGIDSLIFMTGLFGANAVRSPLSDVPSRKARNSQQLEAIIEAALLPDKYENANLVADSIEPLHDQRGHIDPAWTHQAVVPDEDTPWKSRVLKVLNAGATIGAVRHDETRPGRYLVRPELVEFLSIVAKKAFEADQRYISMAELERVVSVALLPNIGEGAETVLSYMHPVREAHGFMAEIRLDEVASEHLRTVRSALNAGATLERVDRAGADAAHYFVHADFYKTLARIRGRLLMAGATQAQIAVSRPREGHGGSLNSLQARIAASSGHVPRLADASASAAANAERRRQFVTELLEAIELEPAHLERIASPEVASAAIAAGSALQRYARRNPKLKEVFLLLESSMKSAIDRAYENKRARLGHNGTDMSLLDRVRDEVIEHIPGLMLMPEAGLLQQLIEELEGAAASDDGLPDEQQGIKDLLVRLRNGLGNTKLDDKASWDRAKALIEGDPTIFLVKTAHRQSS